MELYSSADNYKLYHGSMLDLLEVIEENTIDAVVTDPPYELNFMNNGSGFPKSMNIGKAVQDEKWKNWGTALKPSYEPIIVARKPCDGSCVANVLKWGVGGMNIDECRIGNQIIISRGGRKNIVRGDERQGAALGYNAPREAINKEHEGRFPANTILTYYDADFEEVCGGMPTKDRSNGNIKNPNLENSLGKNGIYGKYSDKQPVWEAYKDSGSAARYFYCAKASKRDRDEGLEEFETGQCTGGGGGIGDYLNDVNSASGKFGSEKAPHKNIHPTVKPTDLMQYLVRLVTPNGGTVLDPFNGSGSTGKAVMYENKDRNKGYKYIGIELNEEYLEISKARIEYVFKDEVKQAKETVEGQLNIFDFIGE